MPTVIVYWSPGRTVEQKKRVSQRIYDALVEDGHAHSEDVLIIFQNIEAGDASRPGTTGTVSAPALMPDHSKTDKEQHES